jgi:hypothetical protein
MKVSEFPVPTKNFVRDFEKQIQDVLSEDAAPTTKPARGGDYSGAAAKSDPAEIRLVRKLDLRIMPILWAMYL